MPGLPQRGGVYMVSGGIDVESRGVRLRSWSLKTNPGRERSTRARRLEAGSLQNVREAERRLV